MIGKIHSIESFGTVDGPGVRMVVFMQGCPLRCKYCHNPDTWTFEGGKEISAKEVLDKYNSYKAYYGSSGGITVTGGEPLMQIDFLIELFTLLKANSIHTCVDTSGINFNTNNIDKFDELIKVTDLFLLDIKHIDKAKHIELTTLSNEKPREFLKYLNNHNVNAWIRYVLVPGITDDIEDIKKLKEFLNEFDNIEKVEVLPYHEMGISKYEQMKIDYPLMGIGTPSKESIDIARKILEIKNDK